MYRVHRPLLVHLPHRNRRPVSTPPSVVVGPPCRAGQLAANLEDFASGGDSNYGWLILRDISPTPCQLTGTIGIVGLNSTGIEDTIHSSTSVAGGLLLTARAALVPDDERPPSGEHVGYLVPGSPDSLTIGPRAGADCQAVDEVIPTTFRLDINGTGTISTSNGDPDSSNSLSHLQVCQGRLAAGDPVTGEPN